ncbi:hypothetical protein M9H77_18663 [Catharanthus roseus]|uniref:Uncharacterized protein n=1 Tax=Catharanthus roseus TaxID=4058 RepID=A0ACC0B824_CATRO|nr:hypothetical protein M9H77_18663 [Catharanthus roseus]
MYEVSQNVDLTLKVDVLSKKFDQFLALNTLPTNSPNVHSEQVNAAQGFHRQNDPYSNTYNSGWRNHPNFSWKQQGGEGLEVKTQILDSHTQSIAKLETQIGQLANAISRRDKGRLPSHLIENPRTNYHEQAKAVITLRSGKEVDNKVGEPIKDNELNENETEEIDIELKLKRM